MLDLLKLPRIQRGRSLRSSSWDTTGRNGDFWRVPARSSCVLADIKGPGLITHIWMTQACNYRQCLIRITWDDARQPSVLCPLGDFFGLGHGIVNSYQSLLFSASTGKNNQFNEGCALNCYVPMPFRKRALIELVNETDAEHLQYFYVDYERTSRRALDGLGLFHAEFRRTNPFGGWGHEIRVNAAAANAVNLGRQAWDGNYVILQTRGQGHYLGCNLSVTNFQGTWWGEGDDMIWVDGYKWPPDLHGTGSEDYLNQAWGMQPNAFLRNGSSIFEGHTGGYQTSYVHHIENPVRFNREIKVTIEHGHANHLANEMSSVAYWYAAKPAPAVAVPPVTQRLPVLKKEGQWTHDPARQCPGTPAPLDEDRRQRKVQWKDEQQVYSEKRLSPWHSRFVVLGWQCSRLLPVGDVAKAGPVRLADALDWMPLPEFIDNRRFVCVRQRFGDQDGLAYVLGRFKVKRAGRWVLHVGNDAPARVFVNAKPVGVDPRQINPAPYTRIAPTLSLPAGEHEILVALRTNGGMGWGFYFSFELPESLRKPGQEPVFPEIIHPRSGTKRK